MLYSFFDTLQIKGQRPVNHMRPFAHANFGIQHGHHGHHVNDVDDVGRPGPTGVAENVNQNARYRPRQQKGGKQPISCSALRRRPINISMEA